MANTFKTIDMPPEVMARRVARFKDLQPIATQRDPSIPQKALDVIYARRLLPVIGLESGADTPIASAAPICGAAGITVTFAVCPPGQGPGLHAHKRTFETFTVMQGRFEFYWGDSGQHKVVLGQFDTISVPPHVSRAFRNIGDGDGVLQVVISGGLHDMNDIHVPRVTASALRAASPQLYAQSEASGITFDQDAD